MSKLELWIPLKPANASQGFGNPHPMYTALGLKGHNGIDYYATDGQIIRASHKGVVTFAGEDGSAGLGIVIRTLEQFDYNGQMCYYKTIYWHLQQNSFLVKPGDIVQIGQPIARADNTGMSTGTHLHFGLKPLYQGEQDWEWWNVEQENGYKGSIDPAPYLLNYYAEDEVKVTATLTMLLSLLKQVWQLLLQR